MGGGSSEGSLAAVVAAVGVFGVGLVGGDESLGQLVGACGAVLDAVFDDAFYFEGGRCEGCFHFFGGGEDELGVLNHRAGVEVVDVFHALAAEGEAELAQLADGDGQAAQDGGDELLTKPSLVPYIFLPEEMGRKTKALGYISLGHTFRSGRKDTVYSYSTKDRETGNGVLEVIL